MNNFNIGDLVELKDNPSQEMWVKCVFNPITMSGTKLIKVTWIAGSRVIERVFKDSDLQHVETPIQNKEKEVVTMKPINEDYNALIDIALSVRDFEWVKRLVLLKNKSNLLLETIDPLLAKEEHRRGYDVHAIDRDTGDVVYLFMRNDEFLPDPSKMYNLDWYCIKDKHRKVLPSESPNKVKSKKGEE